MPESKVLTFPSRLPDTVPSQVSHGLARRQHSLFGEGVESRGKVAFVDIKELTEEPLLRILTMNGVKAVVDLRPLPIFERPRFRHRQVVFYLHDRDIRYVEFALMVRRPMRTGTALAAMHASDLYGKIEPALENGLSLCLYDKASRDLGWLDEMRRLVRLSKARLSELHPRALIGMPF